MKQPDEIPVINVQEHLKITASEKLKIGNLETVITKTIFCQRVK